MITTIGSLPPGRFPEAGDLSRHFLENRPDLFPALYSHPAGTSGQLRDAAAARRQALADGEIAAPREELARILDEQNRRFGAGDKTAEAVGRLARPGTMAVVTGQQAGFLGGPLYTFYKALGAIRAARQLVEDGVDAVPVFWIAADDHDFEEIRPFTFLTAGGRGIETVLLPGDEEGQGRPVSARVPGQGWNEVAESLLGLFADSREPLGPSLSAYRESGSLAEGFGRVMAMLFGRFGLIVADPSSREMKALAQPLLLRFLQRLTPLETALVQREGELEARGYPLQVPPRKGRTGLFLLDDEGRRRALLRHPDGVDGSFTLGGPQGPVTNRDRLAELAGQEPWRFSGSALTRCLFQDYLFPTAAYVGGPGEVAYLAQSSALHPVLGMTAPAVVHRPSFTIFEPSTERFLKKHGVDPTAALLRPEELRPHLLRESADPGLLESVGEARHRLGVLLDDLEDALTPLDPTLSGPVGRVRGGSLKGLDKVEKKVQAALQRRESTTFDALERTLNNLRPRGKPQERALAGLPFVSRWGTGLLDDLLEAVEPCSAAHQLVVCR